MSRGARWTLGVFALIFAAMLAASVGPEANPWIAYLPTTFCVLIAVACISRTLRGPAVRLIGTGVFLLCCVYLVSEAKPPIRFIGGPADTSLLNAILAMAVFGAPGIYVAATGSYPRWGKGAQVFRGEPKVKAASDTIEPQ